MGEKKFKYLTLEEASAHVNIPISTLRKRITEGKLPAYKPSHKVLVDVQELETFIKRSRVIAQT
jgi:excisionase family DNA binding protein